MDFIREKLLERNKGQIPPSIKKKKDVLIETEYLQIFEKHFPY